MKRLSTILNYLGWMFVWTGLHNIIIWTITILLITCLLKKAKSLIICVILVVIILFNLYSTLSITGNARLIVAFSGHPIVAYTTDKRNIEICKESFATYHVHFESGKRDKDGFEIAPLCIEINRIGPVCFSHLFRKWIER